MSNTVYKVVGRIHLAVGGEDPPTAAEWTAYLADIGAHLTELDGVLSLTEGGGPNAAQRQEAAAFWARQPRQLPIAVVTPSGLVRNMANVLSWVIGSQLRAFKPTELPAALQHIRVDPKALPEIDAAAAELRRGLG